MTNIQNMIIDAMSSCRKAGREPVLIVMNPKVFTELIDELDGLTKVFSGLSYRIHKNQNYFGKYQGMNVLVFRKVKDFFIVDDRSWAEQKW